MNLLSIKGKYNQYFFERRCKYIRDTPRVDYRYREDLIIITQVHHVAVDMYLVAIKSFLHYFGSGSVEVLNDGSLTHDDKALLHEHIPNLNISNIMDIDVGSCPKGSCWERLLYLIKLSQDAYVIQLDSDTITLSPIPEIDLLIQQQRGFVISNPNWSTMVSVDYLADLQKNSGSEHVQICAEKIFKDLAFFNDKKYIRGCAAFTGFPKGQITVNMLEEFSQQVIDVIGKEKWNEWGSEQVSSNVMVAQTNDPLILSWPRFQNYLMPIAPSNSILSAALIHFIGSNRYNERQYEALVTLFINKYTNT